MLPPQPKSPATCPGPDPHRPIRTGGVAAQQRQSLRAAGHPARLSQDKPQLTPEKLLHDSRQPAAGLARIETHRYRREAAGEGHPAGTDSATAARDAGKGSASEQRPRESPPPDSALYGSGGRERPLQRGCPRPGLGSRGRVFVWPRFCSSCRGCAGWEAASLSVQFPSRPCALQSNKGPWLGPQRVDVAAKTHRQTQSPSHLVSPDLILTPASRGGGTAVVQCKDNAGKTLSQVCRLENRLSWRTGRHLLGQNKAD